MQSSESAVPIVVSYSRQFRRCNKADCPSCTLGGSGHGPYWYAYWREDGRRRSRYVGKSLPDEAASTRPTGQLSEATLPDVAYPPLRVRTLGAFAVWQGNTPLPLSHRAARKPTMLLKCLLSAPRRRLHREQLAEMLRPNADSAASASYLRTIVHRLRRLLGKPGYLRLEGDLLMLVPAPEGTPPEDWLDALAFEHAAVAALAGRDVVACRTALALYGGDYLPDDPYDELAVGRREELRGQYLALLLHLADLREGAGVLGEAARCLRAVLACDPCHEIAARALMRVQGAAGRPAEAIRTYRQLAEALRRDLDLAPDIESEAQYQAVTADRHAASTRNCNLPTLLTSFLGREQELATLTQLLTSDGPSGTSPACRLLTLTGVGGCGKTRLAIELGHELRNSYPEGLWLVELAALAPERKADQDPIASQALEALGPRPDPDQAPMTTLVSFLRSRRALLVLDNCEHVPAGSAAFTATILGQCPNVRILVTSREALGVLGEKVWRLRSLAVPARPRDSAFSVQDIGTHAAVRLLVERARQVRPDFALTLDNGRAVVEICARLDGIPLALELAAARLGQLSVGDLAARLQDRFRLLTSGNRTALPRHQTLRAAMDWGYELLSADEQALLRMLSVFAGGWTLDAVEAVCSGSPMEARNVPDLLGCLISKSLVQIEDASETSLRYQLLETVRQYAAHHLQMQGEEGWARDRHLSWCLALVERAAPVLDGPEQRVWLDLLETEHDNLRSALAWCTRREGDVDAALRLTGALWLFWGYRGHWSEGRAWLSAALARAGGDPGVRIRALRALGALAENQCDFRQARTAQAECLALARACGDDVEIANALNGLGNIARHENHLVEAAALFQETLAASRQAGHTRGIARALHNLALIAQEEGDYARAIALNEESLAHRRTLGDHLAVACTQYNQAICIRLSGDLSRATAMFGALLPQFEAFGDKWSVFAVHNELGRIACDQGEYQAAVLHLDTSLRGFQDLGDTVALVDVLENWAGVVAGQGNPAQAVRLLGAVEVAHTAAGHPLPPGPQEVFAADIARVRRLLGAEDLFAAKWAEGQTVPLAEIIADVLALRTSDPPACLLQASSTILA